MNKPQLTAEMEKRFNEQFAHLSVLIDQALSYTYVDSKNMGELKIKDIKHFLATALEEQKQELLSEVDEAITKRVLPAPLYGNYKEDRLHQRWQAELNQLKGSDGKHN